MRKKFLTVALGFVMLLSAASFSACSLLNPEVKAVLNNMGVIENTYTISKFQNAVLADIKTEHVIGLTEVEEDGVMVTKDVEFLGWDPDPGARVGTYKAKGLLRLAEMKDYVHDNVLVLYAIYGVKPVEKHDLVIAWYGQAVAGLTDAIMENFQTQLYNWLDSVDMDGLDIVIRKYTGDVAASCAEVLADDGADIMLGWGGNLTTTGGIAVLNGDVNNRKSGIAMGNKTGRYIDLIRDTEKKFDADTTLSRKVWTWCIDNAGMFVL